MITLTIDLGGLNAAQIAMLDAVVSDIPFVPSGDKSDIIKAGEANCGINEYERLYTMAADTLERMKQS